MNSKGRSRVLFKHYNMWRDIIVCILISLLFFLPTIMHELENAWAYDDREMIEWGRLFEPLLCVVIYIVNYFLILRNTLLTHRNRWLFVMWNVLLIVLLLFIHEVMMAFVFDAPKLPPPHHAHNISQSMSMPEIEMKHLFKIKFVVKEVSMFILSISVAVAVKVMCYYGEMRRQEIEVRAERRQIELMGLKAQLNPHFLFNTLNNIYALIEIAPNRAQKAIHDLSAMLRYMIYEASSDEVPLNRDLNFVRDYIELMKLRISPSLRLRVNIDERNAENKRLTPLLFITLIENAFKHVAANEEELFIDIDIKVATDSVECVVVNSCNSHNDRPIETSSGVGLNNIKRQLEMLYTGRYSFDVNSDNQIYKARLIIRF